MKPSQSQISVLLAFAVASLLHATAPPVYEVIDLGLGIISSANGINNSGQICGTLLTTASAQSNAAPHAYLYSNGVATNLGTLGGSQSYGFGVNNLGQALTEEYLPGDSAAHACLVTNRVTKDLGAFDAGENRPADLNDAGQVTGVDILINLKTNDLTETAFLYSGGQLINMGSLGGPLIGPRAINSSGTVVGDAQLLDHSGHAFIYSGGGMSDLTLQGCSLGGSGGSGASCINDSGQVTGAASLPSGASHAFIYSSAGGMTDIGTLPGDDNSVGYSMNNHGDVIGTSWNSGTGSNKVNFLYTGGAMYKLDDLLQPGSGVTSIALGYGGHSINDQGQIAATGTFADGYQHAVLLNPLKGVQLSIHRAQAAAIANGGFGGGIDDPLVPGTLTSVIKDSTAAPIYGGLICDGVTPLLFKVANYNASAASLYAVTVSVVSGGTVSGGLSSHLFAFGSGAWIPANGAGNAFVSLPAPTSGQTSSEWYGYISALPEEALVLDSGSKEIVCQISAQQQDLLGNPIGSPAKAFFKLRRPPIALVHGYNTTGVWGDTFKDTLLPGGSTDPFVVQIQYGVTNGTEAFINTYYPLSTLTGILSRAFTSQLESSFASRWAFTRYDVCAHSQGGVLTRMLCSQQANGDTPAFRNASNFYRGRFRKVVTIGSPHNGTTFLRYVGDLAGKPSFFALVPTALANTWLGVLGGVAGTLQSKFDPWNSSILDLNAPGGRWTPDSAAKFFLIRTVINGGSPPGQGTAHVPAYLAIGLGIQGGSTVLPKGADGVCDLDAQGYDSGGTAANIYTLTGVDICHAEPLWLFSATTNQVKSLEVANVVTKALNGDASLPFGPFPVPPLLPTSQRDAIDAVAAKSVAIGGSFILSHLPSGPSRKLSPSERTPAPASTSYGFQLTPPVSNPLNGTVEWFAEVFGVGGATQNGITVTVDSGDSRLVTVNVGAAVLGDVVLYAHYPTTGGGVAYADPIKVVSITPASATLSYITLLPDTPSFPSGMSVPLQVWATYTDASVLQVYTGDGAVAFSSLTPATADVSASGIAGLKAKGSATIQAIYNGNTATDTIAITAGSPPVITSATSLAPIKNQAFSYQVTASNDPTSFGADGLPPGLSIDALTGLISGTPTTTGVFPVSIGAANSAGLGNNQAVQVTVQLTAAPLIAVEQPAGTPLVNGSTSVGFGSITITGAHTDLIFTIKNTGNANLTGLGITLDGSDAGSFSVTAGPTAPVTGPSGSTTFTVRLAPTTSGAKSAALHIASNDLTANPFSVGLTGTGPPAGTSGASNVTSNWATLNGSANPGGKSTTAWFQYGASAAYGSTTYNTSVGSGTVAVPVNYNLAGLAKGSTYHYRIVINSGGTLYYGADQTFTTAAVASAPAWHYLRLSQTGNAFIGGKHTLQPSTAYPNYCYYKDTDNNVWVLYFGGGVWNQIPLSTGGIVDDWFIENITYNQLYFRGNDGHIYALWFGAGKWNQLALTTTPNAAGDVAVDSGTNYTFYRDTNNNLSVLWYGAGKWNQAALTSDNNVGGDVVVDPVKHFIFYRGKEASPQMWVVYFGSGSWNRAKLTITGNVAGNLLADPGWGTYYLDSGNNTWAEWFTGSAWAQSNLSINTGAVSGTMSLFGHFGVLYTGTDGAAHYLGFSGSWINFPIGPPGLNLRDTINYKAKDGFIYGRTADGNLGIFYYQ